MNTPPVLYTSSAYSPEYAQDLVRATLADYRQYDPTTGNISYLIQRRVDLACALLLCEEERKKLEEKNKKLEDDVDYLTQCINHLQDDL
jgi:hypothetical protein